MPEVRIIMGSISELGFGYNAKMEVYASKSLDMIKLGDILRGGVEKNE